MKRKLFLAVVLALVLILIPASSVLAWDVDDPEVANNEDFIWGQGWDGGYPDGTLESHYGEQSWSYFPTPNEGYNLYQDDATDIGNLDAIQSLVTRTPDVIDLLDAAIQYFDMDGGFYYMTSVSPDTCWYWATEPSGYNYPGPAWDEGDTYTPYERIEGYQFLVIMFDERSFAGFDLVGGYFSSPQVLAEPVRIEGESLSGLSFKLEIPEGTEITLPGGARASYFQLTNLNGPRFDPGAIDFSQPVTLSVPEGEEWIEILNFTSVREGVAQ